MCRPREKIHRPQTRRRRENNEDSLEKMQAMRRNMKKAGEVLEALARREQKKAHLAVRGSFLFFLVSPRCSLSSVAPWLPWLAGMPRRCAWRFSTALDS